MPTIDLSTCIPETLAESADLDDLLDTVRAMESWSDREAEVLDYIYRQRVDKVLRMEEKAEVRDLLDHLDRVTYPRHIKKLQVLEKPYHGRWTGYMDILEDRLIALESPVPRSLLNKAHVRQILEIVAGEAAGSLASIRDALGLRPANLTRILKLMEANDLIVRRTEGRSKRIMLGPAGRQLTDEIRRPAAQPRGASYLRERPAA